MRRKLINYHEMIGRLEDFFLRHKDKMEAIPVLKKIFEELFVEIRKFEKAWATVDQKHIESVGNIRDIRQQVVRQLIHCQIHLSNYCIEKNLLDNMPNFRFSEKVLNRYGHEKLLRQMDFVIIFMERMGDELTATGLTAANLDALKSNYETFDSVALRPWALKNKIKLACDEMEASRSAGLYIIKERLDRFMKALFVIRKPYFFKAYLEATAVKESKPGKSALLGKVLDKDTKLPVLKACIYIDSINYMHEVTGIRGGFRVARLDSASYEIRIEAPDFKTVLVNIIIRKGERNVMNVEMEYIGELQPHDEISFAELSGCLGLGHTPVEKNEDEELGNEQISDTNNSLLDK